MKLSFLLLVLLALLGSTLARIITRDSDETIKIQQRHPKHLSLDEIRGKLREVRAAGSPTSQTAPLNGDTNQAGIILYSGTDRQVIFVLTYTANNNGVVTRSNFWRSGNYGNNFTRMNSHIDSGTLLLYPQIIVSPENYRTIIIPHESQSVLYISTNEGLTFTKKVLSPSVNPRSLLFHSTRNWFLAHYRTSNQLYISQDLETNLTLIDSHVNSVTDYQWGVPPYDDDTAIYYNTDGNDGTSQVHLYKQQSPYSASTKTEFDPSFGAHDDFLLQDRYIFAQKTINGVIQLYTSYDRKNFQLAHIPSTLAHQNYLVNSIDYKQALVIVEHTNGQFNLYLSEETGQYFALSLPDIVVTPSYIVDLELVNSMNFTTLVSNQNVRSDLTITNPPVRTLISFDAGGNWEMLHPPSLDANGNFINCQQPSCSLHLHMSTSQYWRTGVYSRSSAPGVIIAHGNTGSNLNNSNVNLFISSDGGGTWTMTLSSTWGVSILDYGGLIVAAQDYHQYSSNPSSNLKYSCDMGSSWSTFSFSSSNAVIFGVITEPGEATTVVSLYGVQNHAWTVFTVNLTNIFTRACSSGDFYTWRPYDINSDTGCLLGAAVSIERRVPSICCLTGVNYVREISYSICGCTGDDFECDYGYAHANGITGPCVKDTSVELPDPCAGGLQTYQKSQGYRKIGRDVCAGGMESQYGKVETPCCADGGTTDSTGSSSSGVTTGTVKPTSSVLSSSTTAISSSTSAPNSITSSSSIGIAVAVILGVILLIAMLVIFVLFVVVIIVMVKLHSKSNGGNYRRVPVSSSPEEERLTFRNLQEPINSGGDEDDDNPLPL